MLSFSALETETAGTSQNAAVLRGKEGGRSAAAWCPANHMGYRPLSLGPRAVVDVVEAKAPILKGI